jgi:HAE1 family hydrophobic/amphiphilic exporter-1
MPRFKAELPQSVEIQMVNDRSLSIREAVHDVQLTLLGTIALVVLVIFLFLHRLVATLIPAATIPISLIGAVALLYAFGYSLDNVSLLGITLAVGLVVDDAIVVLENIMRYVEKGMEPFAAALRGAREVGFTIVSISISLVAVFIPIFFMPGVIGLLFHEFAVVVALAVLVSAIVSLTLVPMLASRLLKHVPRKEGAPITKKSTLEPGTAIGRAFERGFRWVHGGYMRTLDWTLAHRKVMLLIAGLTFVVTGWLFATIPKGFFPEEDIGQIQITTEAAEDISFTAMKVLQDRVAARSRPTRAWITSAPSSASAARPPRRTRAACSPCSSRAANARRWPRCSSRCASAFARFPALPSTCSRCRTCAWAAGRARRASSTRCRA